MSLSYLPTWLSRVFHRLAYGLDRRSAARLPVLLLGILLASGRRTATSWFRAAGITDQFRPAYRTIYAAGREAEALAVTAWASVQPCLAGSRRLLVAIDDTPTPRYGPCVEGAGIHHNPTPGPAGEKFLYGHVWVSLAALAKHPRWGTIALPLLADLYVRRKDLAKLPKEYGWAFRSKLELAADHLQWLSLWARGHFEQLWVVTDGGYAKRPFLRAARQHGFTVIGRVRKDAALWSVPEPIRRPGQPGPLPTYGKQRLDLAKRAGQKRGLVILVQNGTTSLSKTEPPGVQKLFLSSSKTEPLLFVGPADEQGLCCLLPSTCSCSRPPLCCTVTAPGETAAGSAETQPDQGITRPTVCRWHSVDPGQQPGRGLLLAIGHRSPCLEKSRGSGGRAPRPGSSSSLNSSPLPPCGSSWLSSTRGSGNFRHSSRRCDSGVSIGPATPPSSAPPGRSAPTR